MLYKLIDNSSGKPNWIWIAEIKGFQVNILYGAHHSSKIKWHRFDPTLTANNNWQDWRTWSQDIWSKEPFSKKELFLELL